jgi:hypothetical protein
MPTAAEDSAEAPYSRDADQRTGPQGAPENRVSWQFRSGDSGFVDCSSPEWAKLIAADLRPDAKVWIGGKVVRDGWQA